MPLGAPVGRPRRFRVVLTLVRDPKIAKLFGEQLHFYSADMAGRLPDGLQVLPENR
jgi:hypothetical protein